MGDAVGTLTVVPDEHPTADADTALIELTLRTSDAALLDSVYVHEEIEKGNVWRLFTPDALDSTDVDAEDADVQASSACMRYDVVLRVPAGLEKLRVVSHTATQVHLSGRSPSIKPLPQRILSSLFISLRSPSDSNLFTSAYSAIGARRMALQMSGGEIRGEVALGELLHLDTQQGNVAADLAVVQLPQALLQASDDTPATLRTITGPGRTSLRVIRPSGGSYSPITAEHRALSKRTHAVFDYINASFEGTVDLEGAYAGQLNEVDFYKLTNDEALSNAGVATMGKDRVKVSSVESTWTDLQI